MKKELKQDIISVIGGLYRLNHPNSVGYLFNPAKNGFSIFSGLFCSNYGEIFDNPWSYFVPFETIRQGQSGPASIVNLWADPYKIYRINENQTLTEVDTLEPHLKRKYV